ncbi:MAG: proline--tRNA ligase, partial [Anaerolineae bacterium]
MRMSRLFGRTLRDPPADAAVESHRLLVRAGFVQPLAAGIFTSLPLARRSLAKIASILRQEIDGIGGQEISMPVVQPAEIWQETGRFYQVGAEMGRFADRSDRRMVLAMTAEEVVGDLVRKEIRSYRQLPQLLYQIQTKWRDDPRPRAGLIRAREFTMLDSYSLDADEDGLDAQYRAHYQAYFRIFQRSGLPVVAVRSDVGIMGGELAHEFMYLTPSGEDTVLICGQCGYKANRQVARFSKPAAPEEALLPTEKVATPDATTIEALANFLEVPRSKTAKAVFLVATLAAEGEKETERFVFAVVRGDMELNEAKLANAVKARSIRPATDGEIRGTGAVPGYASPVGLQDALVIVDDVVTTSPNLVAGANEEGYHLLNVNYGRDFSAEWVGDIAAAQSGDPCPDCGSPLESHRGVEAGNIFKLGTHYSEAMGSRYLDQEGRSRPVVMGSYGIGLQRLLASIAEEHHDERGLAWPISVAPFQVHLVVLRGGSEEAERLYRALREAGIETLFDERDESPGVKFADADLIGLPLRFTVSKRSLAEG